LIPTIKQVMMPGVLLQKADFPAAVAAGPAVTLTLSKSVVEYVRVHCRPATTLGDGVLNEMGSKTVPPRVPTPLETESAVCAAAN